MSDVSDGGSSPTRHHWTDEADQVSAVVVAPAGRPVPKGITRSQRARIVAVGSVGQSIRKERLPPPASLGSLMAASLLHEEALAAVAAARINGAHSSTTVLGGRHFLRRRQVVGSVASHPVVGLPLVPSEAEQVPSEAGRSPVAPSSSQALTSEMIVELDRANDARMASSLSLQQRIEVWLRSCEPSSSSASPLRSLTPSVPVEQATKVAAAMQRVQEPVSTVDQGSKFTERQLLAQVRLLTLRAVAETRAAAAAMIIVAAAATVTVAGESQLVRSAPQELPHNDNDDALFVQSDASSSSSGGGGGAGKQNSVEVGGNDDAGKSNSTDETSSSSSSPSTSLSVSRTSGVVVSAPEHERSVAVSSVIKRLISHATAAQRVAARAEKRHHHSSTNNGGSGNDGDPPRRHGRKRKPRRPTQLPSKPSGLLRRMFAQTAPSRPLNDLEASPAVPAVSTATADLVSGAVLADGRAALCGAGVDDVSPPSRRDALAEALEQVQRDRIDRNFAKMLVARDNLRAQSSRYAGVLPPSSPATQSLGSAPEGGLLDAAPPAPPAPPTTSRIWGAPIVAQDLVALAVLHTELFDACRAQQIAIPEPLIDMLDRSIVMADPIILSHEDLIVDRATFLLVQAKPVHEVLTLFGSRIDSAATERIKNITNPVSDVALRQRIAAWRLEAIAAVRLAHGCTEEQVAALSRDDVLESGISAAAMNAAGSLLNAPTISDSDAQLYGLSDVVVSNDSRLSLLNACENIAVCAQRLAIFGRRRELVDAQLHLMRTQQDICRRAKLRLDANPERPDEDGTYCAQMLPIVEEEASRLEAEQTALASSMAALTSTLDGCAAVVGAYNGAAMRFNLALRALVADALRTRVVMLRRAHTLILEMVRGSISVRDREDIFQPLVEWEQLENTIQLVKKGRTLTAGYRSRLVELARLRVPGDRAPLCSDDEVDWFIPVPPEGFGPFDKNAHDDGHVANLSRFAVRPCAIFDDLFDKFECSACDSADGYEKSGRATGGGYLADALSRATAIAQQACGPLPLPPLPPISSGFDCESANALPLASRHFVNDPVWATHWVMTATRLMSTAVPPELTQPQPQLPRTRSLRRKSSAALRSGQSQPASPVLGLARRSVASASSAGLRRLASVSGVSKAVVTIAADPAIATSNHAGSGNNSDGLERGRMPLSFASWSSIEDGSSSPTSAPPPNPYYDTLPPDAFDGQQQQQQQQEQSNSVAAEPAAASPAIQPQPPPATTSSNATFLRRFVNLTPQYMAFRASEAKREQELRDAARKRDAAVSPPPPWPHQSVPRPWWHRER